MADNSAPELKPTLGLTGLTMNAMALIAPGAFLWLTFLVQATTGATSPAMWAGIVLALLLCLATAVCYAELAKLYPGTGSSYYFAEQSFLNHEKAWPYARLSKFIVGWGSHLYYWVYPGVMVGVMGILCGFLAGTLWPSFMSASNPGPMFMMAIAVAFSFGVAYIAHRGVNGSTSVNIAYPEKDEKGAFLSHPSAASVVGTHNFGWMFVQATVAILILVGFESVTSMGGEAKNPRRDVPIAVVTSLLVQGAFCYLIEYFAANYFLNNGYSMQSATGSAAPIGDMMVIVGNAILGGHGRLFMLVEAFTVFLAIIGTTLSCMNTGARVTYAMGKDEELPDHLGRLHSANLTPHRAIWTLAVISAVVGCVSVVNVFGDAGALQDSVIKALPQGFWSSFGYLSHDTMAALPNSLLTMTLASNFGTFLLYALSCIICVVGFHNHPKFSPFRHLVIPVFGLAANLVCMAFYLIGPFMGYGTKMEPLLALGIAIVWALYGGIYFVRSSKASGRTTMVKPQQRAAGMAK